MYSSEWNTPVLTVKNKKYYLKDEVDVLLQQLHEQWKEQQQELEDCREALANYQAQERRIASVLISSQQLAEQQVQLMREKAKEELLVQEDKRRRVERATALMLKQQKESKAVYCRQLQEICDRIQGELLPMLSAEEVEDESGV